MGIFPQSLYLNEMIFLSSGGFVDIVWRCAFRIPYSVDGYIYPHAYIRKVDASLLAAI